MLLHFEEDFEIPGQDEVFYGSQFHYGVFHFGKFLREISDIIQLFKDLNFDVKLWTIFWDPKGKVKVFTSANLLIVFIVFTSANLLIVFIDVPVM